MFIQFFSVQYLVILRHTCFALCSSLNSFTLIKLTDSLPKIRGWLLKRGLRGPTASLWRRRYFRCDQGSKIYYYKSASEGTPRGYVSVPVSQEPCVLTIVITHNVH